MQRISILILSLVAMLTVMAARVDTLYVATNNMPAPVAICVVVPETATPDTQCPVVYMLNGYDGNNRQWLTTQPRLPQLSDQYGMIFVLPDGQDTWYWNSPEDPGLQMESFIIEDLVPYIDARYPTKADRQYRAITGLSMGGHGALWLSMRHPEIFGSAGSMSGAVDLTGYVNKYRTARMLGDGQQHPERWKEYSVISLVPTLEPDTLNLIIDCGIKDPFAGINDNLHQALVERGIPHDYTSRPGNHSHPYWANSILYHLLYFNQVFQK